MSESAAYARRSFSGAAVPTTLAGSINNSATSFSAADLSTWTATDDNGPGRAEISDGTNVERFEFTGVSANSFTGVTRGIAGTTARAWDGGETITHVTTDRDFDEANRLVNLVLGVGSVVAGDIFYVSAASAGVPTALTRIAKGTAGQRLTMNSGATAPAWADPANPRTIGAPAWATAKANTNWSSVEHSFSDVNTYPLGYRRISGGSQNDDVTWEIPLEAGTYTFTLVHSKGSNIGIYTVALDGTSAGTIDGYNGTALAAVSTITGITVAASGVKSVRLRMATKNASSSSYYGSIQGISFTRTA